MAQADKFDSIRMFTMADKFETENRLVPGVYTRSLLYFISGVLEDGADVPILGMERYMSGAEPYGTEPLLAVRSFFDSDIRLVLSDTLVLNPTAPVGIRSRSITHGGFDNDGDTRASLTAFLSG